MTTNLQTKDLFKKTEFSLVLIILLLFCLFSITTDTFLTSYNLTNLLKQCSIIGIVSISATLIIITGGIDLSCGSIVGISSLFVALLLTKTSIPTPFAIIIAIIIGGICGLYNGFIVHEFKVPPFIATLGSMTIIRGLIKVIGNAKTIAGLPKEFSSFSNSTILGIPNLALLWILVLFLIYLILRYTIFGRNVYVLGSGLGVAKLSGVNIRLTTYKVYIIAGLLCGLSGVLLTTRINSSVPTSGAGYEMNAIAATVIGGASLAGAKGTILGTALGTVLMMLISNGGVQLGINSFVMQIMTGVLITVAVIIDMAKNKNDN